MKFGEIPLSEAEGAILAHSRRVGRRTLKKGTVLTPADIEALRQGGCTTVVAARLEPGDLDENAAAEMVARAAAGANLRVGPARTGRCNLFAGARGLAMFDPALVDEVNLVDEAVTVATVPPYQLVEAGDIVATVKVITFGVPGTVAEACAAAASKRGPLFWLAALQPQRVGLIQTRLPGLIKDDMIAKMIEVTRARIAALGGTLGLALEVGHDEESVAAALKQARAAGCDIVLVLGASAIVDRRDIVPVAIERASGRVEHFGMPVDPGNLMLLARLGSMRVLGLPGSARSPRLHGFDWVLQRLHAGLDVTGADLMHMGVGGLLKEIPSRPLPRAAAAPLPEPVRASADLLVAAIVLAAGQSRRMGSVNKLLADIDGVPMIRRVVSAVADSRARPILVVTGHEAERVRAALGGLPVTFVDNPDYAEGLSASLRHGLAAVPASAKGALVVLGDMPLVDARQIDRLIDAFDPAAGRSICVPVWRGKRGNPVLWARRFFTEMQAVAGDVGARHLIGEHDDSVHEVEMESDAVLVDVDSPDALVALTAADRKRV
ncbi:MAG TPA: molybdopterin-binding/glycosyltransferase family 2 protein [Alphaproteobacteria bacterium]